MVTYHPQWLKVRELIENGAIGKLVHVQGAFSYFNVDPDNMRNRPELGGGGLPDIGVYPTVATRFSTGKEPQKVRSIVHRDPNFGTDIFADVTADFGDFTMGFYVSTQLAARQLMVFHGDKGFIEVTAPFNAIEWGMPEVKLHSAGHDKEEIFRFAGVRQYRTEAENFVRHVEGEGNPIFTLEDSVKNQKFIDAIYRASDKDGWEQV